MHDSGRSLKIAGSLAALAILLCVRALPAQSGGGDAALGSSNILTITTYHGGNEGHLIIFPDSTTMSIDCADGSITAKSHFHSDHCASCNSGQYNRNNVYPGQVIYSKDGVTVTVVAANGKVIGEESVNVPCDSDDENKSSMALLVKYRGFDYLTAGDLTATPEGYLGSALAARGVKVDVLKVSHHGSTSSSRLSYLQDILPEYVTISGTASSPKGETLNNLVSAGVKTIYYAPDYDLDVPQVYRANGDIVITTDGATYSFSGGSPSFSHGPYQVDEYVPPDVIPPHLLVTEAALDTHRYPENHDWVEIYLPPDAASLDLSQLYVTDLDQVSRAATGAVTLMPGDVAVLHDADGLTENNGTGKGSNGWWDIFGQFSGSQTWNSYHDEFAVSTRNTIAPSQSEIIDSVVWSDDNGSMLAGQAAAGNYLINLFHWGDPVAGSGLFTTTNEGPAIGPIKSGYAQRLTTADTNSVGDWTIGPLHSQGTPPPTPALPTPTPGPPPPPKTVAVTVNASSLSTGSPFSVGVQILPILDRTFDAYAVILGPGVVYSIRFGNSLAPGVSPIARKVLFLPAGYHGTLLEMTVPPGVAGDYQAIVGLTDPGAKVTGVGSAFAWDVAYFSVR